MNKSTIQKSLKQKFAQELKAYYQDRGMRFGYQGLCGAIKSVCKNVWVQNPSYAKRIQQTAFDLQIFIDQALTEGSRQQSRYFVFIPPALGWDGSSSKVYSIVRELFIQYWIDGRETTDLFSEEFQNDVIEYAREKDLKRKELKL